MNDIVIKQSLKYYFLSNSFNFFLIIIGCYFLNSYNNLVRLAIGVVVLIILLYSIYKYVYFLNLKYTVTDQQIISVSGVFMRTTNYTELYRIYDYVSKQSLIYRILDIMCITLYGRDLTTPSLNIDGIKCNKELVNEIRKRVEHNKNLKSIVELNNMQ